MDTLLNGLVPWYIWLQKRFSTESKTMSYIWTILIHLFNVLFHGSHWK